MNRRRLPLPPICVASLLILAVATTATAENWPFWRGPRRDGTSAEKGVPVRWSKTENVAWRLPLPGPAGATPVVWEDRIFLTSVDGDDLVLLCIGADGKPLWRRLVGRGNRNVRGDEGNSASPSPSTDGEHVWAFVGSGDLACYDFDGKEVWKINLQKRYGPFKLWFGMTPTPLLVGERLYLQVIHGDLDPATQESYVVALDKATGKEIWKRTRRTDARNEAEHAYASPILYRDDEREMLLTHGADYLIAHRLTDGSELWRCGGLNPKDRYNPTLRFIASPVAVPGLIVVPSAKNGPVFGLRQDLEGDVTGKASAMRWRLESGTPDVPSPLVVGGLVYLCRETGTLRCLDARTGELLYQKRTVSGRHRASPVYADGRVYLTARDDGIVTVVKAGRRFEIVAQNEIGEPITASPVVSGGRIYLRSYDALYAIGPGD